ncbi:Uncharacterised protein [Enterobacter cloacae]|uniref:YubB ferredoxin-like domain-containing protein n=1 Tax=Enterobacter cloacae TaxID=550 RepID=A0A377M882_ENTCL|nr:Uncharacterised protein [Enterobacter cloacae]
MQLFGMEFPAGHQASWSRDDVGSLTLSFASPWYPPSGEVMGIMSQMFDCEIRHLLDFTGCRHVRVQLL